MMMMMMMMITDFMMSAMQQPYNINLHFKKYSLSQAAWIHWAALICASVSSCGSRLFQHVGPDTAKLRSWQSWCVGSDDHYEPLVIADMVNIHSPPL